MTAEEKFEAKIKDNIKQHNKDWSSAREEFMKKMENLVKVRINGLITEQEFTNGMDDAVMEYASMINLVYGLIDKENQKLSIVEDIELLEKESD